MKRIGWYMILLICLLGYQVHAVAQHISVSAPSHVAAGENFRVAYTNLFFSYRILNNS